MFLIVQRKLGKPTVEVDSAPGEDQSGGGAARPMGGSFTEQFDPFTWDLHMKFLDGVPLKNISTWYTYIIYES